MKSLCKVLITISVLLFFNMAENKVYAQNDEEIPKLENPFSIEYLKRNLRKSSPRLVYNSSNLKLVRQKLKNDSVIQNVYAAIKLNADKIFDKPLLERKKEV